jgi:hypothetical protein
VVSGGGHGYIKGQGSLDGGQLSLGEAGELGRTVERDIITTPPGTAGGDAASRGAELDRQRTKKLPSLLLSTGFMS